MDDIVRWVVDAVPDESLIATREHLFHTNAAR